jgi:hypothetical protein
VPGFCAYLDMARIVRRHFHHRNRLQVTDHTFLPSSRRSQTCQQTPIDFFVGYRLA